MSYINIENLSFSYSDSLSPVFNNLSLRLDTDWRLGIVGKNGTGKSTFLNILCGELSYKGKISANTLFKKFPCKISDYKKCAYEIAEEVALETQLWQIQKEMGLLGLESEILYRPFKTLSGGERTKFLLSVLFAGDAFPLLDEPTDHVDANGRGQIAGYLSKRKGFIVVSHDRAFLDNCCDHILCFNDGKAELIQGNYSVWREEADKREKSDRVKKDSLEKERARLHKTVQTTRVWANKAEQEKNKKGGADQAVVDRGFLSASAARMQKRSKIIAQRRQDAEEDIKELLKGFNDVENLKIFCEPFFKSELLRLSDISVAFSEKTVISQLEFFMSAGERVAITGINGAGKSVLLKIIVGELENFCGKRDVSPRLKVSYVPQIYEYCGSLTDYAKSYGIDSSYFNAILFKLGFDKKDFTRDMRLFSEGQKKKAALARSLCERANLYIWDEPLNYLDVVAREQLTETILNSDVSLLFVEHDRKFIDDVATRILEIQKI